MKNTFVSASQNVEVAKTEYAVLAIGGNGDSSTLYESEDEASARARYEQEVKSAGQPVDIMGWSRLYHIELVKTTFDEDDDIIDMIGIESSGYFNMI